MRSSCLPVAVSHVRKCLHCGAKGLSRLVGGETDLVVFEDEGQEVMVRRDDKEGLNRLKPVLGYHDVSFNVGMNGVRHQRRPRLACLRIVEIVPVIGNPQIDPG